MATEARSRSTGLIAPKGGSTSLFQGLLELLHARQLLLTWTMREIRIRYKHSLLGAGWAILQPLALMLVFTVVFSYLLDVPTGGVPYPLFTLVALLPWTFFATSIGFGVPTLINNLNLVTKTYFPREILPLGSIGVALIDFLVASSIFLLLMLVYRTAFTWMVAWLPLILAIQILLTIGITLLGSGLVVLYRDIRFVVPLILQVWLYATPVMYPIEIVPTQFIPIYMLNPMVGIIDGYRQILVYGTHPNLSQLAWSGAAAIGLFFIGYLVFKKLEGSFADII